ncbi:hypothetical protein M3Y97_00160800 [Aphelenchoides bicaudatus]|nr:hypothetical protein M3Y97_00160800 [Aphelenchoides bicaudatus]
MSVYVVRPRFPCIGIYCFCIFVHLIVALYGAVQVVWYPITYGFMMSIIYVIAIVCVILRFKILYFILVIILGILLFLLFVFFILAIYMTAAQPPEGVDIVYDLFPQDGNFIETYKTLSIAIVISSLILLIVNILGFLATMYALCHNRKYEETQIVTRA